MNFEFGDYVRNKRETLRLANREFSLRKVALKIGLEPSYLSKIERGDQPPPSADKIAALAETLGEDPDYLLALAGKVSDDLLATIQSRPEVMSLLLRELRSLPDHSILRLTREIRDGRWI